MTVTIPRAEILAVARQHGDFGLADDDSDWTTAYARDVAAEYRKSADYLRGTVDEDATSALGLIAEADDLDALVDRIEREAA